MKRHPALVRLSREHHHALALAKRAQRAGGESNDFHTRLAAEIVDAFEREIEGHFQREESSLLPALREAGEIMPVERTLSDHAVLRELVSWFASGDTLCLNMFGDLLAAHVRFEEQKLFPLAEAVFTPELLSRIEQELLKSKP